MRSSLRLSHDARGWYRAVADDTSGCHATRISTPSKAVWSCLDGRKSTRVRIPYSVRRRFVEEINGESLQDSLTELAGEMGCNRGSRRREATSCSNYGTKGTHELRPPSPERRCPAKFCSEPQKRCPAPHPSLGQAKSICIDPQFNSTTTISKAPLLPTAARLKFTNVA